jgi:AhpD family alkylhydroperoxidase
MPVTPEYLSISPGRKKRQQVGQDRHFLLGISLPILILTNSKQMVIKQFRIPQRTEVTPGNQALFDQLTSILGSVPNLYASFAWSENGLNTYLAMENSRSSLNARQREAIHLIVSEINKCPYCLSAHSAIARLNGFTEEEVREIRLGSAGFDGKLDALVRMAKSIAENGGVCNEDTLGNFYLAGLTKENLVDTVLVIGYAVIANYLLALTRAPVDFPLTADWENPLRDREG